MRIAELAASAGVPTSTVRYYERVGLMDVPARTESGYRDYDDTASARLRFITRARHLGLSCDQVAQLVPVWAGTNCGAAHERVGHLVDEKRAQLADQIAELEQFAAQLDAVRAQLDAVPPLPVCRTDLDCCVPDRAGSPVDVELVAQRSTTAPRTIDLQRST